MTMTYLGDLAVTGCMWGWACVVASYLVSRRYVQVHAVAQLIGLSGAAGLGWVLCLVGYAPLSPRAWPLELMGPHPVLGPVVWLGGPFGLAAMSWRYRTGGRRLTLLGRQIIAPVGLCIVAAASVCAWLWSVGPPLRPDEGLYHLSLPLQYARSGGYVPVPGHGNAGFFALGDMLFWWCLVAGAPGAARLMQLLVMTVGWTALVMQAQSAMRGRVVWAWVLWLLAPIVLWDVSCAYVDIIEALFSLVGVTCLARWYQSTAPRDDCWLAQAAWLLGAAAASRQLALGALPALALVVLWRLRGDAAISSVTRGWRVAAATALCLCLPSLFIVHNMRIFHNPLYPFAADWFPQSAQLRPSQLQVLERFLAQHGPMQGDVPRMGWDALWHLPYALWADAAFASPCFDGVVGPVPILALGVGLWRLRRRASDDGPDAQTRLSGQLLLGFAALRTGIWLSTSWQARFVLMPLGALSLWLCQAWPAPDAPKRRSWRRWGSWLVSAGLVVTALGSLMGHMPRWDGRYLGAPRDRYAARLAQLPASRLCERAVADDPAARVMLVWTQRLAVFCPAALHSDSYDEAATWVAWLEAEGEPDVLSRLHAARITHLLVDTAALLQVPDGVEAPERERWARIAARWRVVQGRDLTLEDASGAVQLYAVRPP